MLQNNENKAALFRPSVTEVAAQRGGLRPSLVGLRLLNKPEQHSETHEARRSLIRPGAFLCLHAPTSTITILPPPTAPRPVLPLRQESIFHKRAVELQCPIISR